MFFYIHIFTYFFKVCSRRLRGHLHASGLKTQADLRDPKKGSHCGPLGTPKVPLRTLKVASGTLKVPSGTLKVRLGSLQVALRTFRVPKDTTRVPERYLWGP